jgi:DNA-binding CsgD family transcriptional regulator
MAATTGDRAHDPLCDAAHLTRRQRQVLALTAAGNTSKKTAGALGITAETVNTHIKRMMTLAGVTRRTDLIALAISQGILDGRAYPPQPTGRTCLRPAPPPPGPRGDRHPGPGAVLAERLSPAGRGPDDMHGGSRVQSGPRPVR